MYRLYAEQENKLELAPDVVRQVILDFPNEKSVPAVRQSVSKRGGSEDRIQNVRTGTGSECTERYWFV